jgi:hypothetical protein
MRANKSRLHQADVIAVFESQDDADEAVLQLRLRGFRDSQIGYFAQHPTRGFTDLLDHHYGFVGAIIGSIAGAALGVGMARLMDQWWEMRTGASDFFGLALTMATFVALFVGFIGWGIGVGVTQRAVDAPAVDPSVGPFVLAVAAGAERDRAWSIMREYGGHELPPGAMMAQPLAV